MTQPLADLPNLGEKTADWLLAAGIPSEFELRQLGTIEACRKLLLNGQDINLLMAYALAGAIHDHHWNKLPPSLKQETRQNFRALQQKLGLK
ncbi:TfoX/Sxy family DNA transformation protein [Rubritalea profundi]|uniref:TfoX C-terminal domain-containing protein n=1 Tax=Rubritalea profundi TaxID=1658618 RepID=A0A2S7U3N4_9BACT|nr:TfoX/Sxy family DNA transformation protein [Rubritalea profundi]PQJ28932.1 hypothetical protein BSZ32_10825 [Rubritalea profundi]